MAIFPVQQVEYIHQKDQGLTNYINSWYMENVSLNQQFWGEANTDALFEAGNQYAFNSLYGNLIPPRHQNFYFNRTRPIINQVDGYQRQHRKSIVTVPTEEEAQKTSDQLTKTLFWVNRNDDMAETFSTAFRGALVSGLGLLHFWLDYRSDPISGDIRMSYDAYNSVLMDAFFTKMDLSDCTGIFKRSFVTHVEAISLLPDYAEEIASMQTEGGSPDGKFQFMPQNYAYSQKNLLTYDEFYYRDFRKQKLIVDTKSGLQLEWRGQSDEALRTYLNLYPQLTAVEHTIPTVKLAIVLQGRVMSNGPNPLGIDRYPFAPMMCYFNPQLPDFATRIQGIVRSMRSPQFLYNRFLVNMSDALEAQFNTGYFFKENTLLNPYDLQNSGPGRNIGIKEEASLDDIRKIAPAEISQGMFQLSEVFSQEIFKDSGVTEELMGVAADDISGFHTMLKQSASLVSLQTVLDRADVTLKIAGDIMLESIQANFVPGKIQRITQEEPTEEFYSKAFRKYDIAVEEGANTSTQKQLQASQLLNLRQTGVPVPDDLIIKALNLENKTELIERMEQDKQQAMQAQQSQMQAQIQEMQARTQLAQARAVADEGLGVERLSRVEENKALAVERRAEAERDHYAGMLDLVKSLKELDQLDINQIEKLILLARIVKEKEEPPLQEPETGAPVFEEAENVTLQQPNIFGGPNG